MPEFDNGWILPDWPHLVVNTSGSPEPVLTLEQWRILRGRES